MEKYKVLLVDDEEEVIDAIEKRIKWNDLGFTVVGSANNGVKALELAEKLLPDVVITDIKMPYMTGLELSQKLNDEYPNIHIIIFTGFDQFEYAKEAVHLEIEEYMLKPINSVELTECLTRLKNTLDKERDEKLNVRKLQDYFLESLPMLRINFFVSLIEGRVREDELEKYIQAYQINMTGPLYVCVAIHTSENNLPEGVSHLLLSMSVEREVKERIGSKWKSETFTYLGNSVMIIELSSEDNVTQLTDECDKFCRWAASVMKATVTIGIGKIVDKLININTSYESAREAVSYRVLYGVGRAINISEVAPVEREEIVQPEDTRLNELFKCIHIGDKNTIEEAVKNEIIKLHKYSKTVNQYTLATMEIVGSLYRFCTNNYIELSDYSAGIKNPYEKVPEMDELTLTAWLTQVAIKLSEALKTVRNTTSSRIIVDAKNIVRNRYMEADMSLDTVCSELGVSKSYFSSMFKKETGIAFITYLTDFRMENAAKLILETNAKSYEIAEQVGYLDANYFSYVFKKKYGVSPSKYKTDNKG